LQTERPASDRPQNPPKAQNRGNVINLSLSENEIEEFLDIEVV
jgi:hypothetical protein